MSNRFALSEAGLAEALGSSDSKKLAAFLFKHAAHVYPAGNHRGKLLAHVADAPHAKRWELLLTEGWQWREDRMGQLTELDPVDNLHNALAERDPSFWEKWKAADVLLVSSRCVVALGDEDCKVVAADPTVARPEVAAASFARTTSALSAAARSATLDIHKRSQLPSLFAPYLRGTRRVEIFDAQLGRNLARSLVHSQPGHVDGDALGELPWLIAQLASGARGPQAGAADKDPTGGLHVRLITDLPEQFSPEQLRASVTDAVRTGLATIVKSKVDRLRMVDVCWCPYRKSTESVAWLHLFPLLGEKHTVSLTVSSGLAGLRTAQSTTPIRLVRCQSGTKGHKADLARFAPLVNLRSDPAMAWPSDE